MKQTHLESEEAVDGAHPLGVALGKVIVDRDDMHAFAGKRVQVAGERGHERLALARLHLGDLPLVQSHAADELHIEVAKTDGALGRLAHDGKRLGQQGVERLPGGQAVAEHTRLVTEFLVAHALIRGLERVDGVDGLPIALEVLVGAEGQQLRNESHVVSSSRCARAGSAHSRAILALTHRHS